MSCKQATPKIFETGAMRLNAGKNGTVPASGGCWGEDDTIQDLTTDNWAFPWINFGNAVTINTEEDNSVTTKMFKANQV